MRAGAIPILVWGSLLGLSLIGCWIVTDDGIQVGEFAFAVGVVYLWAGAYTARSREAIQRGEPEQDETIEAVPAASLSTVGIAVGISGLGFGLVWSRFFVYFGGGLALFSAGRLWFELRAQRASRRLVEAGAAVRAMERSG